MSHYSPLAYTALIAILAGCFPTSGTDDSADTGSAPVDTGSSTDDTDSATDDTDGSTDDTDEPGPAPGTLTERIDPCEGLGTPTLHADSEDAVIVGCGNGIGLWHSTDAGATFDRAHPSGDLYVFEIERSRSGDLLVCGHDYDADGVLLYRGQPGGEWTPLLRYGNNSGDPTAAYLSNCGAVAETDDDRLVVASLTAGDITWSTDGGTTWAKEYRYWEDDNLEDGGYSFHYLFHLIGVGGDLYGAGSQITEPPVFFQPSPHTNADWWGLDSVVIDPTIEGEVWALATTDGGTTWLAGGRDQSASSRASGFLHRSTDGGDTWASLPLPEGTDIVRDVAFDASGQLGVAVGHKYPVAQGGFALITRDGGATWTALDADVPLLESAAVAGERFWIAGDAYLSMGAF